MEGVAANEAETKMPALGGHFWGGQYATKAASNLLNWCGDRNRIRHSKRTKLAGMDETKPQLYT
jgi:hypothetical protein